MLAPRGSAILFSMAPRPPESREAFLARLRAAADRVVGQPVRFGAPHHTHAVVLEDGVWRVRRLELDRARADAYRAEHRSFMPEHAEMLSEPGPTVALEAASLAALIAALQTAPWPLR